jgi:restriction endonuclease S subunit
MKTWDKVPLVKLCRPRQWPTLSKAEMLDFGIPVYGANGIIGYTDRPTHTQPTILIGCRGSCGTVHVLEPPAYANGNAMALDDLRVDRVSLRFLQHFFQFRGFADVTTGASQPQIVQRNLNQIEIPLPPLEEQKRIAVILDHADDLLRKRQRALDRLNQLGQAIFIEMFGAPNTPLRALPTASISEVADCLDSRRRPVKASDRQEGDVPYYGANGQQGWIDQPIFNETLVLVAEDGGHFETPERGVAYRIDGPSWVNNHAHILRAKRGVVTSEYLHRALRHYNFTRYINGSTRSKLTKSQLMQCKLAVPPYDQQVHFDERIATLDALIRQSLMQASKADRLFTSLQHRAFRNELTASSPKEAAA